MPHQVNFCPWCGTGQHAGIDKPAHAERPAAPRPAVAPAPAAAQPVPAPAPPTQAALPASPAAQGWGRVRTPTPAAAPAPAPTPPAKPAAKSAGPRARGPVRLRWWLLGLAAVLVLWYADQPRKIERRIERAVALGAECKLADAQKELIALRSTPATGEQLQRLQQSLNNASVACERKQRPKTLLDRQKKACVAQGGKWIAGSCW